MLDFIVMQMSRVNREKGYAIRLCTFTHFAQRITSAEERALGGLSKLVFEACPKRTAMPGTTWPETIDWPRRNIEAYEQGSI